MYHAQIVSPEKFFKYIYIYKTSSHRDRAFLARHALLPFFIFSGDRSIRDVLFSVGGPRHCLRIRQMTPLRRAAIVGQEQFHLQAWRQNTMQENSASELPPLLTYVQGLLNSRALCLSRSHTISYNILKWNENANAKYNASRGIGILFLGQFRTHLLLFLYSFTLIMRCIHVADSCDDAFDNV